MTTVPAEGDAGYRLVPDVIGADETARLLDELDASVQRSEPVDCLVTAGGVVAMRPLILHASSKAESGRPRRVLHIEYIDSLDLGDGLELARA